MDKKGQTNGLVTGLIFGVASLVIGVIIAFVVVSTIADADLLTGGRDSATRTNESGGHANITGYTLDAATLDNVRSDSFSVSEARNVTNSTGSADTSFVIPAANFTVSSGGVVTNATVQDYCCVNFTYSYENQSAEELSANRLRLNFSEGVDNVSDKIPTILLIAAVILIIGILTILVLVWQRMRLGGGSTL